MEWSQFDYRTLEQLHAWVRGSRKGAGVSRWRLRHAGYDWFAVVNVRGEVVSVHAVRETYIPELSEAVLLALALAEHAVLSVFRSTRVAQSTQEENEYVSA